MNAKTDAAADDFRTSRSAAERLTSRFVNRAYTALRSRGEGFALDCCAEGERGLVDALDVDDLELVHAPQSTDDTAILAGRDGRIVLASEDGWAVELVPAKDDDDVRAFRAEAGSAGDLDAVAICDRAITGDADAFAEALEMMVEAAIVGIDLD